MMKKSYVALAFYHLTDVQDPDVLVKKHKVFFENKDLTSRIYISKEGINGQMSAEESVALEYKHFLREDPRFKDVVFKEDRVAHNIFPRQTVKVKEQLVALDRPVDFTKAGVHLSPKEWRERLEKDDDFILIDVRNDYESEIGFFEGAEKPPCQNFRQFREYTEQLKQKVGEAKEILMYCTGGIRCEFYSAYMKENGFDKIFQLEGGVINYGHQEGAKHWKGKLFVFDDRMAVPISEEYCEPVACCRFCEAPCDTYYNCSNMDCNELFLACPDCIPQSKGCCQKSCLEGRVRPFDPSQGNKPFCRKHLIEALCQER